MWVCVCALVCTEKEREGDFKELTHMNVEAGKYENLQDKPAAWSASKEPVLQFKSESHLLEDPHFF